MEPPANRKALVAIDLGAQSCRVSLLRWIGGIPRIDVMHRFPNSPVSTSSGLHWDIEKIFEESKAGLRLCADAAPEGIETIGVDGWAVDYVRLAADGSPSANPFCYRDERTEKSAQQVHQIVSPSRLYSLTGIQILRINTLYQLYADKQAGLNPDEPWINLPEYLTYRLGGKLAAEYTNATHTGLVKLGTHCWSDELFQSLRLHRSAAPEIVPTGSPAGALSGELSRHPSLCSTQLIFPACHDTASAIAAIPAAGEDWAFISSGTWSLVGTVINSPCVNEDSRNLNFTNLGGVGNQICFLKNINGMWLLGQCMEEWEQHGHVWPLKQLLESCSALPAPSALIDVDEPELMLPGNMTRKINAQLKRSGQQTFAIDDENIPLIANTVFHSLAARYAEVLSSIAQLTNKKLKRLFIVGGGSQNTLLNRLTAERSGLEVIPGSTESTTIGNFAIQLAALQGDWNPSTGVASSSVAKWAEELSLHPMALSGERDSH
jgi:rhamnulokinase